ncbi:MAG: hypothetical protein IPL43_02480 [Micropruina sp.]|nr:hypothetical protein [Micropruina sp.]
MSITTKSISTQLAATAAALTLGAASLAFTASTANAAQSAATQLAPGQSVCVQQYASYQARAQGTSKKPIHFRVLRNGSPIYSAPGSFGFLKEFRSSWGTFPGPGYYQVCAVNNGTTFSQVTVSLLTDSEF